MLASLFYKKAIIIAGRGGTYTLPGKFIRPARAAPLEQEIQLSLSLPPAARPSLFVFLARAALSARVPSYKSPLEARAVFPAVRAACMRASLSGSIQPVRNFKSPRVY